MTYAPKMRGLLVSITMVACVAALGAGPAHADNGVTGSATTTSTADVQGAKCVDVPVDYTINFPTGINGWQMTIDVVRPDGTKAGTSFLYADEDPVVGTTTIAVCGNEPGVYTIRSSGLYGLADENYDDHRFSLPTSTLDAGLAKSQTHVRKTGQRALTVTVTDTQDHARLPVPQARVIVQQQLGKHWKTLRGGKITTNHHGRATYRFPRKADHGCVIVRAKTRAGPSYLASTSRQARICR